MYLINDLENVEIKSTDKSPLSKRESKTSSKSSDESFNSIAESQNPAQLIESKSIPEIRRGRQVLVHQTLRKSNKYYYGEVNGVTNNEVLIALLIFLHGLIILIVKHFPFKISGYQKILSLVFVVPLISVIHKKL